MHDEYIDSLEATGTVMNEEAWREWIKKEANDALEQDENAKIPDADEVINQLWEDGYITDRFKDDARNLLNDATMEVITNYMDDGIREEIHSELAPCADEEFLTAYMARHYVEYNEQFTI